MNALRSREEVIDTKFCFSGEDSFMSLQENILVLVGFAIRGAACRLGSRGGVGRGKEHTGSLK